MTTDTRTTTESRAANTCRRTTQTSQNLPPGSARSYTTDANQLMMSLGRLVPSIGGDRARTHFPDVLWSRASCCGCFASEHSCLWKWNRHKAEHATQLPFTVLHKKFQIERWRFPTLLLQGLCRGPVAVTLRLSRRSCHAQLSDAGFEFDALYLCVAGTSPKRTVRRR